MTGFYRDGYCRVGPEDGGNHAVAGSCFQFHSIPPHLCRAHGFVQRLWANDGGFLSLGGV